MTPVFGHGRLRLYLLKLLDESPRHGYEIIQQLRERFAGLYAPSAGTVYPRLARLESEGLVRHETDGGRKIYHITAAGQAELAAKATELDALEAEIRDSVRGLAEGIRDEVRESARTVREELENQAREAQRDARRGGKSAAQSAGFPFGPTPPMPPPMPPGAPIPPGGFPFGPTPAAGPPPESVGWNREQWRDWKHEQQDQWRDWRNEFRGQRDQWKDWQRSWKEQWARQWKEQWEEQQQSRGFGFGNPGSNNPAALISWLTSAFSGFDWASAASEPSDAAPQDAPPEDTPPQDAPPRGSGGRSGGGGGRADWERIAPQLRDLFGTLRNEVGPLAEALRAHGPLTEAQLAEVKDILHHAIADIHQSLHDE
jgi:DNA-binding PadR family transcriptional regulator